jgi:hypothetical protein
MRCVEAKPELAEAALGAAPAEVAEHVDGCAACAREVASLAAAVESTKRAHATLPLVDVSPAALERARAASRRRERSSLVAAIAIVAVAALAGGLAFVHESPAPTPAVAPPHVPEPEPGDTELQRLVAPRVEIAAPARDLATVERAAARPFADAELASFSPRPLAYEVADLDAPEVDRVLAALPRAD